MQDLSLEEKIATPDATLLRAPTLGRVDWLRAALASLIESGVGAVKITQLAERLGVTRGSFYWHFKDREEMLAALVEYWHRKNTAAIIAASEQGPELLDAVLALMEAWLDVEIYDPQLDLSIRSWSRSDATLRAKVRADDEARLEALRAMYARAGRSHSEAVVAARNIYYIQMGYYALEVAEPLDTRLSYLASYVESYTGVPLSEARAQAFIASVKPRITKGNDENQP